MVPDLKFIQLKSVQQFENIGAKCVLNKMQSFKGNASRFVLTTITQIISFLYGINNGSQPAKGINVFKGFFSVFISKM